MTRRRRMIRLERKIEKYLTLLFLSISLVACENKNAIEDSIWFSSSDFYVNEFVLKFENDSAHLYDTRGRSFGFAYKTYLMESHLIEKSENDSTWLLGKGQKITFSKNQDTLFIVSKPKSIPLVKWKNSKLVKNLEINKYEFHWRGIDYRFLNNGFAIVNNEKQELSAYRYKLERFEDYYFLAIENHSFTGIIKENNDSIFSIHGPNDSSLVFTKTLTKRNSLDSFQGIWTSFNYDEARPLVNTNNSKHSDNTNLRLPPPPPPPPPSSQLSINDTHNLSKNEIDILVSLNNIFGKNKTEEIINHSETFEISNVSMTTLKNKNQSGQLLNILNENSFVIDKNLQPNESNGLFSLVLINDSTLIKKNSHRHGATGKVFKKVK